VLFILGKLVLWHFPEMNDGDQVMLGFDDGAGSLVAGDELESGRGEMEPRGYLLGLKSVA
jgi:hypothetical protein